MDDIPVPLFPRGMPWANVATLRMEQQRGRPVIVAFWDFLRVSCLRTLPYLTAWHEKYEADGLRVIGLHCSAWDAGRDPDVVRAAVERLDVPFAVGIDSEFEVWKAYGNQGWPARYLWSPERLRLYEYHYGEGAYDETERAIQELLEIERELVPVFRPEDDPDALLVVPTADVDGAFAGEYAAGEAWGVFAGTGTIVVNGSERPVEHPGAYLLEGHDVHTESTLEVEVSDGVEWLSTQFQPGLAP